MKSNAGFSLLEIMLAMILLVSVGAMTMYSFASVAKTAQPGANIAYNFGRGLLEQMYEFVRQDTWGTAGFPLSTTAPGTVPVGTIGAPQGSSTGLVDGKNYTATYTVTTQDANANGQEDLRRVRMSITW